MRIFKWGPRVTKPTPEGSEWPPASPLHFLETRMTAEPPMEFEKITVDKAEWDYLNAYKAAAEKAEAENKLPSRFQIGEKVETVGGPGTIVGINFRFGKVFYQVDLTNRDIPRAEPREATYESDEVEIDRP